MQALGQKAFTKTGAEGVYCAALPEQGLGIALKCDDGAGRAAEAVMASLILAFAEPTEEQRRVLSGYIDKPITNWNGIETGRLRVVGEPASRAKRASH
jgi:L-asparaginase II